jgi:hypothetical protein
LPDAATVAVSFGTGSFSVTLKLMRGLPNSLFAGLIVLCALDVHPETQVVRSKQNTITCRVSLHLQAAHCQLESHEKHELFSGHSRRIMVLCMTTCQQFNVLARYWQNLRRLE